MVYTAVQSAGFDMGSHFLGELAGEANFGAGDSGETFGPLRYCRDIVAAPVPIQGGYLTPPEGPGLGVTLEWEAIQEMRV